MALDTGGCKVLTGQREAGLRRVIERGAVPIGRRMAELAILRESGGGVGRIAGALIVFQMAGIAGGAQR